MHAYAGRVTELSAQLDKLAAANQHLTAKAAGAEEALAKTEEELSATRRLWEEGTEAAIKTHRLETQRLRLAHEEEARGMQEQEERLAAEVEGHLRAREGLVSEGGKLASQLRDHQATMILQQRQHGAEMRSAGASALAALASRSNGPKGARVRGRFEQWRAETRRQLVIERALHNMHLCHLRGMRRLLAQAWRTWSGGWREMMVRAALTGEQRAQRSMRVEQALRALLLTARRRESAAVANGFFRWRHSMQVR
jgi:hypothetical protein